MKLDRRTLIIILVLLLAMFITLHRERTGFLPAGRIIEITPIDLEPVKAETLAYQPLVEFSTSKGIFTLELRPDLSPEGVVNYLAKWSEGFCNGTSFHRVEDWVVQGCDPKGDGTGGQNILKTEKTSAEFLAGSVGVARKPYPANLSNDSQFFIVKKDSRFLDGEYTYLGKIISGMDVINLLKPGDVILSTTILTK